MSFWPLEIFEHTSNMETLVMKTSSANLLYQCLIICSICTILVWCVQFLWNGNKLGFQVRDMPGPFALPIVGNLYMFWFKDPSTALITMLSELQQKYSSCYRVWLGSHLIFVASNVEYSEEVLNNQKSLNKHSLYRFLKVLVGDGLLTSSDSKWRKHRKLISPSFNQKMLNSFFQIFDKQSDTLIDVLNGCVGVKGVTLYNLLCKCNLDTICETSMGVNVNLQKSEENFGEIVEKVMELGVYRLFHPLVHSDIIWNLSVSGKNFKYYLNRFLDKTIFVINTKLDACNELKRQREVSDATIEEKASKKRSAILDLLIEGSKFTEEELRDEVNTFIIAGTETTASSLCFIFVVLGLFPEIQGKVYEEITDIFGGDEPITIEGVKRMKYTERVIKETMRLFPIAPIIARIVTEDLIIGDQVHPAGSGMVINIFMLHRNPQYWPEPLKFDPDRFLPEEVAKRSSYSYIPFSMGPRMCIGWRYAMLNMKMILAKVVRNFKVHTEYKSIEEIELAMHFVLRMKDGPKVWMEKR